MNTSTTVGPDCQVTWREFYSGIEFEAEAVAGRALTWTLDTPGVAIAVVDEAGSWAYAVAKGEGWR